MLKAPKLTCAVFADQDQTLCYFDTYSNSENLKMALSRNSFLIKLVQIINSVL